MTVAAMLAYEKPVSAIIAIDPGPMESAWLILKEGKPLAWGKEKNDMTINRLQAILDSPEAADYFLVIEKIASLGMPVGEEVFETVYWSGRFAQAFDIERMIRLSRMEIKMHLCNNSRAKDSNIRQALIDRFGGKMAIKKGGDLYKISGDVWSALAVAITFYDVKDIYPLRPFHDRTR